MATNGISALSTKQARQVAKLNLGSLKRKGYTLNADGTGHRGPNTAKVFYRERNAYDIEELPTQYNNNDITDNANVGGLIAGRPWTVPVGVLAGAILMETGDLLLQETGGEMFTE